MKKILLLTILFSGYSMSASYTICDEYTASALNVCVNNRLQRGWELHGSLSVNFRPSNDILVEGAMRYTQALYKD